MKDAGLMLMIVGAFGVSTGLRMMLLAYLDIRAERRAQIPDMPKSAPPAP